MSNTSKFFQDKKRWSVYKDKILSNYLPIYLSKILATNKDTLIIDGFAGRGTFDDGTIGSPLIIRDRVREALSYSNYSSKIYPIFIEYGKKRAEQLKKALNSNECYVRIADYKTEALSIIARNKHRNIFLYVDPFGIKHLQYNIFEELAQNPNSVELLLNLNSFGFIREGCRLLNCDIGNELDEYEELTPQEASTTFVNDIDNMNRIANGDYWQEIIELFGNNSISAKEAEEMFVSQYIRTLGEDFEYIFNYAVKTGDKNIPKYRMIFATNHIQGALMMSENMIKCNNEMMLENHNNQLSMFDYDFAKLSCKEELFDIIKQATDEERVIDIKDICLLTYICLGPKYLHKDIREALKQLEKEGAIILTRTPTFTKLGKPSTSMDFIKNTIMVQLA